MAIKDTYQVRHGGREHNVRVDVHRDPNKSDSLVLTMLDPDEEMMADFEAAKKASDQQRKAENFVRIYKAEVDKYVDKVLMRYDILNVPDPKSKKKVNKLKDLIGMLKQTGNKLMRLFKSMDTMDDFTVRILSGELELVVSKTNKPTVQYEKIWRKWEELIRATERDLGNGAVQHILKMMQDLEKQHTVPSTTRKVLKVKNIKDAEADEEKSVDDLHESLLYEFKILQSIKNWWSAIQKKIDMFISLFTKADSQLDSLIERWDDLIEEMESITVPAE